MYAVLVFRSLSVQHDYLLVTSYCSLFGENPDNFNGEEQCCWASSAWDF